MNKNSLYRFLFYVEQNYSFSILRPLQQYAKSLGHEVKWLLVGKDVSKQFLLPGEEMLESVDAAVTYHPDAVFAPGDRIPGFIPGLKVQVFHGLNESKRGNLYPERGLFDLYCTEGHERTGTLLPLAQQRGYFKVVETGWIKLDSLFSYVHDESYSRPQIAFSSTFSASLSCAELVYDQIKMLSQQGNWQWLVTLHPKMAPETVAKYRALENENLMFFDNDRVIELLHRADVMVCDNSSIFQEFLLLGKPVVTVNNREVQPSFINITQPEALAGAIEHGLNPDAELLERIAQYGPAITPYLDGKSVPRVLAAVTEMLQQGWQDRKPKNVWRNLKMRKSLGYWKW
ncbi:CDP-glycerol glycerophosphotransferase family protein [uncultured Photobacterium sp.]|uniref:CDP-glycerol glycerophosphotransferase family protein n=1 Tax=uncultured Photobacterium sp. TaxID=173973 RepID=UPI0026255EFB|nr:CDP-glycerol glycerophosphotransferase family protein [uncultured Photobacterium sp.]